MCDWRTWQKTKCILCLVPLWMTRIITLFNRQTSLNLTNRQYAQFHIAPKNWIACLSFWWESYPAEQLRHPSGWVSRIWTITLLFICLWESFPAKQVIQPLGQVISMWTITLLFVCLLVCLLVGKLSSRTSDKPLGLGHKYVDHNSIVCLFVSVFVGGKVLQQN